MLYLGLLIAFFIAGQVYLRKIGYSESDIDVMGAGMCGYFAIEAATKLIMAIIALSAGGVILQGLIVAFQVFFFTRLVKRAGI